MLEKVLLTRYVWKDILVPGVAEHFGKWYAKLGSLGDLSPPAGVQELSLSGGLGAEPPESEAFLQRAAMLAKNAMLALQALY